VRPLRLAFALTVLLAICLLNTFDRALTGALGEPIKHEWALQDRQLGAAFGVFLLAYSLGVVPAGWMSDRWPRKWVLAGAVALWSGLTTLGGMVDSYEGFLATRAGVGLAEAAFLPAASSLVAAMVPGRSRGRAMSYVLMGMPLGIAASFWGGAALASRFGWRTAFLVAVWPGILTALALLAIEEPTRSEQVAIAGPRPSALSLLRLRSMRGLMLANVLHGFSNFALATFLAPFAVRCLGLPLVVAGRSVAFASGVGPLVGLAAGGLLADRMARGRSDAPLVVSASAAVLAVPLFATAFGVPGIGGTAGFVALMSITQLLLFPFWALHQVAIHAVVPTERRGVAVALSGLVGSAIGGGLGPLLVGRLSDAFAASTGSPATGLARALLSVPTALVLHALVLAATLRAVREDAKVAAG
jgi:predicted MFS family arabinose efflux permease